MSPWKSVKASAKNSTPSPFACKKLRPRGWYSHSPASGGQTCSKWALLQGLPKPKSALQCQLSAPAPSYSRLRLLCSPQLIMSAVLPPCSWPVLSKGRGDIAAAKPAARPTRPGWRYRTGGVELKRSAQNSNRNHNEFLSFFRIRHTCICIGKLWQGSQTGAKDGCSMIQVCYKWCSADARLCLCPSILNHAKSIKVQSKKPDGHATRCQPSA